MMWKLTAALSGATVFATWLGWTNVPPQQMTAAPAALAIPPVAADIQEQAARLHVRVRSQVEYQEPSRNPFVFRPRVVSPRLVPPSVEPAPSAVTAEPERPSYSAMRLSGIATDDVAGSVERTAIISTVEGIVLVKVGQSVGEYTVQSIDEGAVALVGGDGTILGKHGVNIANFALGRDGDRAVGVVIVDETSPIPDAVLDELRSVKAIREARLVRV